MRVAVSNIAWPAELDAEAYALLAGMGVEGIEIAPTRVWPGWSGISAGSIGALKAEVLDGLEAFVAAETAGGVSGGAA